jgi:hypothetical protein
VIINPVDNEVREPRVFSLSLEQFIEEFQGVLPKVVSEYFEGHQSGVVEETLSKECKTEVIYFIVSHIDMDQRLVDC